MNNRLKLVILILTIALALLALWRIRNVAEQVRQSEEAKVRLWATAIGQRSQMMAASQQFFMQATIDEHRKMQLYADILQSFNDPDLGSDMKFSLAYVNYIVDSSRTPIIITTASDSIITVPQELAGQKLDGALMDEYSVNPPFHYNLWGLEMALYYKESEYFTRLREVLGSFVMSFLSDITQNSVLVPVVIVDSSRTHLLAYGNLDSSTIATPYGLKATINDMADANDPIELTFFDNQKIYVYYSSTPLLRSLRWVPLVYIFVAVVLLVVSYNLFRTTRNMEQNRIWVGMAKETAHQLGTPISSLAGWIEYLRGKELTPEYATELENDLHRLETITHRFSKIGSAPELTMGDLRQTISQAVDYLKVRSPRRVKFVISLPDDVDFNAPHNAYLFQWVIENLCKNAIDAMEGDGTITIVGSADARHIYIDVSDTGRGMSSKVQKKIFTSGFSTKSRGWGLGLPLARRIIDQYHNGRLYLKFSVVGQGSTFRIVLNRR